jgi:hypothetical protein
MVRPQSRLRHPVGAVEKTRPFFVAAHASKRNAQIGESLYGPWMGFPKRTLKRFKALSKKNFRLRRSP